MARDLEALQHLNHLYYRMSLVIYRGLLTRCGVRLRNFRDPM